MSLRVQKCVYATWPLYQWPLSHRSMFVFCEFGARYFSHCIRQHLSHYNEFYWWFACLWALLRLTENQLEHQCAMLSNFLPSLWNFFFFWILMKWWILMNRFHFKSGALWAIGHQDCVLKCVMLSLFLLLLEYTALGIETMPLIEYEIFCWKA